jgi:small ligand-binding sensory domain FIST
MLMQGVEDAAVGNEEQEFVGVGGDPPGDDRRDALENLLEGIGVCGQYVSGTIGPVSTRAVP